MKKGFSLLLAFLLAALLPCTVLAETVTEEEFAAMQSLPELYRKFGPILRTYSFRSSDSDTSTQELLWYAETEEQGPIFEFFDGTPSVAYDGFTIGYSEEGTFTIWCWLSGWEEAVEDWTTPLLNLPQEELELTAEEDGGYSLIHRFQDEDSSIWEFYGSLDSQKNISSIISLYDTGEIVLEEVLALSPMENPLVSLDMEELLEQGTREITLVRLDGTEQLFLVPQQIQIGWIADGEYCPVCLDAEHTQPIMFLTPGSDPVTLYESAA